MKNLSSKLLILFFLALSLSCVKKDTAVNRTFHLGVTPWPPDFNAKGKQLAFDFINESCDMVSFHFDDGIPYEEVYRDKVLPKVLKDEIDFNLSLLKKQPKVLLSVAALNISRKEKANYYSTSTVTASIKTQWKQKSIADSTVIKTYIDYISLLITQIKPDYVNYGVESNHKDWTDKEFEAYKLFLSTCYKTLKNKFPDLPFFVSFIVGPKNEIGWLQKAKALDSVTDFIGISAYPYSFIGSPVYGTADPKLIPVDLFDEYKHINTNKPLCFAETGYIAEDLNLSLVHKISNEQIQNDYVNYLFDYCNKNNAEFIIWFCAYDYDAAINTFNALGYQNELPLLWQNTGLINEKLYKRSAYFTWNRWLKKEKI
jgi:hypothetical protein